MQDKKPVKWIFNTSKKQRAEIIILIFSNAFFAVLSVLFAFAIKGILDGAQFGNEKKMISYSVMIFGVVVLQFVFRVIVNGLTERVRSKLEMGYKSRLFSEILKKKQDKISVYHSGELMNRITSDVSVVSDGITTILPTIVSAATRLICAVVALVLLDWTFAVAFIVAGILVFVVISLLKGKLKSLHKKVQETDGKARSFMQECIEHLLAVKTFSVDGKIESQADSLQEENFKVKMKRKNYSVIGHATYNFIFSAGYLFALIYGAVKIFGGVLSYGDLSAILQLVNNVQVPFASLSNVFPKYYAMVASAERLMEIEQIENEPLSEQIDKWEIYSRLKGISAENLTFAYDRDKVLKNASLYINKGDFVMISGASGVGKSTLIKLLMGVYSPDDGELYADLNDEKVSFGVGTRSLFSFVPQGNMIFSGTLRDNVTFIKSDASEKEIENALRISEAESFIKELPKGLDTVVGEDGVGLSEGQVQRIAIARAVLANRPIMLLDESTSALDEETERKVLDNLKTLKEITLIIISHKKAAAKICNRKIKVRDKKFIEETI
jgi:ATP-binding cassette subfamily B protein